MANIEINVDNKKYTKSSDNKKLIKTNTLKEKASADVEEVDLDSETYNVESAKTEAITTDSANENYSMTSSEIKSIVEQMKKTKKEYVKYYNEVESKYTDNSNKDWYKNGILTANPTTTLPYTPEEYKEFLMSHNHISSDEELKNNKDLTSKITSYNKEYEEQFEKIVGISYSEYKELKDSYKSDLVILDNTISSLSSLAKEQKYNEVLDTDSFKSYMSTKSKMTFSDLEKNYNEYNSKSADITESAEASINMYDTYNPMYIIEYAEKLAEKEKFDITDVLEKQVQSYQYDLSDFYEYYKVMTDDEKNLYSYYFETKGREAAEKYFNDMKDSWNKKIAYNRFQEDVSDLDLTDEGAVKESIANILNVNVDGIGDGINQFMSGIANSITNNKEITIEEYKAMYYLSYLEQNSKILSTSYKVGTATGNMLPSVTASVLTAIIAPEIAPSISQGLIGVSSFGNSKHNALIQGYSLPTSILYGVMSGSSEVLFEKFGGIIGIADNPGSNAIIRALKEGVEEGAQSYIQAGIDAVVLGKEINLDDMNDDALESFIIGALVAGELNFYNSSVSNTISIIQNGKKIMVSSSKLKDVLTNILKERTSTSNSTADLTTNDIKTFVIDENNTDWYANKEIKQNILNLDSKSFVDFVEENSSLINGMDFSSLSEENKFQYYIFLEQLVSKFGTENSLKENILDARKIESFFPTDVDANYQEKISNLRNELYQNFKASNTEVEAVVSKIFGTEVVNDAIEGLLFTIYTAKDANGTYEINYKIGTEEYSRYVNFSDSFEFNRFIIENITDIMNNNFEIISKEKIDLASKYNINSEGIYTIYYLENGKKKQTNYYSFKTSDNKFDFPNASDISKLLNAKDIKIIDIKKSHSSNSFSEISSLLSKENRDKYIEDTFYNFYLNNMNKSSNMIRSSLNKMVKTLKNSGYSIQEISSCLEKANTRAINDSGIFETYISDLGLTIKMQNNMNINISDELSELRSLPKEIQNLVSGKTFTYLKTPDPTDYDMSEYYGIKNFQSAAETKGDGSMTFFNGKGTKSYKGTMTHEIGHTFDKVYASKIDSTSDRISTSTVWKEAMNADEKITNKTAVTDYPRSVKEGDARAIEDFAESFKLYYTNPNKLKKYKNRYEILEKILPKN